MIDNEIDEEHNELSLAVIALCKICNVEMSSTLPDMIHKHEKRKALKAGHTSQRIINKSAANLYQRLTKKSVSWSSFQDFIGILNLRESSLDINLKLGSGHIVTHTIKITTERH